MATARWPASTSRAVRASGVEASGVGPSMLSTPTSRSRWMSGMASSATHAGHDGEVPRVLAHVGDEERLPLLGGRAHDALARAGCAGAPATAAS